MWMRCSFNTDIKCDYINNNLAGSFNSWVKDIKDLPIDQLADKTREMVMVLFEKRRIGERLQRRIPPAIIQQLHTKSRGLGHLKPQVFANRRRTWGRRQPSPWSTRRHFGWERAESETVEWLGSG